MFNPYIRDKAKKAKQFAQEHTTLVACGVTAVIASKFTYDITVNHCMEKFLPVLNDVERQAEVHLLQSRVMLDFINQRELGEELTKHVLSMRQ
jgi:hypothetical protein